MHKNAPWISRTFLEWGHFSWSIVTVLTK